jgi:hypothetical protein
MLTRRQRPRYARPPPREGHSDDDGGEPATQSKSKSKSKTITVTAESSESSDSDGGDTNDTDVTETKQQQQPLSTEGVPAPPPRAFDMRDAFPIDEKDEHSNRVLAILTFSMQKLGRRLTETEQMGYLYAWLTLGASLIQVNVSEYGALNMTYVTPNGQLECSCYRAEIVGRLHAVCYETFSQVVDHLHGILAGASMHPLILGEPTLTARSAPLDTRALYIMLQTQVEMCHITLRHFHQTWEDFSSAFEHCEPDGKLAMRHESAVHTATLGVIASHLLQVLATLSRRPEELKAYRTRWLWQSAVVLNKAEQLLPLDETDLARATIRFAAAQLKLVVYRDFVTTANATKHWAYAAYFTQRILKVLGVAFTSEADLTALVVYQNKIREHHVSYIPPDDPTPMKELEKHREELRLSDAHITTMFGGALATVFLERVRTRPMIPRLEPMTFRLRDGTLQRQLPLGIKWKEDPKDTK